MKDTSLRPQLNNAVAHLISTLDVEARKKILNIFSAVYDTQATLKAKTLKEMCSTFFLAHQFEFGSFVNERVVHADNSENKPAAGFTKIKEEEESEDLIIK